MHIPGHKGGKGAPIPFLDFLKENAFRLDLSDIEPLDNLLAPKGLIKEALDLASEAFGSDRTFFIVNGSTTAIQAMFLATLQDQKEVIFSRASHRSAYAGLILSGATPIYIPSEFPLPLGFHLPPIVAKIREIMKEHPGAPVFITSPNYYGMTADIPQLVHYCHDQGIPLLVDEAHGAHFVFHESFPKSALTCGADLVAQSAHKTLTSLTQSSLLHWRKGRVDEDRVRSALFILQTTSPSYLLTSSLDACRWQMANFGHELWEKAISLANYTRSSINDIDGLHCLKREEVIERGEFDLDPTKLVISFPGIGISGIIAAEMLRGFQIEVELSDFLNVLAVITVGDDEESVEKLIGALKKLRDTLPPSYTSETPPLSPVSRIPNQSMTPREAFFAPSKTIPFKEATGMICSEIIAPYPPGIPLLAPGEIIDEEIVSYLLQLTERNVTIHGLVGEREKWIRVVS